ncbi:MAG: hypothetical protein IT184_01830 [Acidobacteria bacterium]|nr:hypothetical protein [Acidobacteriota bacterium]
MRLRIGAVFCAVLLPTLATAQSRDGKLALAGELQWAHITEDEGFLGAGPGGAIGIEYHATASLALGVIVEGVRHVRDLDAAAVAVDPAGRLVPLPYTVRWKGTATFVMTRLSRSFGVADRTARPLVWGSLGLMRHGGTTRGPIALPNVPAGYSLQPGDLATTEGRSSLASAFEGGGGVSLHVSDGWTLQPFGAFRFVMTGNAGPKYIFRTGVVVALRF